MAAYINALGEEGTLDDCRYFVRKARDENRMQFNPKGTMNLTKDECIKELQDLFYYEHNVGN